MLSDAHEKKYQMFAFRSVFTEITEESPDVKHAIWEMYLLCCLLFTSVIWFNLWNTIVRQTKDFTVELKLEVIAEYLRNMKMAAEGLI